MPSRGVSSRKGADEPVHFYRTVKYARNYGADHIIYGPVPDASERDGNPSHNRGGSYPTPTRPVRETRQCMLDQRREFALMANPLRSSRPPTSGRRHLEL